MAHDVGNQGRLSGSSDLRAGLREQRGPLSTSTGVSTLVGVGRENLCFSQAILASCLSKEGWEHSQVEGNKEDAGSLGQLLLVLLSWLLKSFPVWLCIEPPLPALSNRSRLGWTGYWTCSLPGCWRGGGSGVGRHLGEARTKWICMEKVCDSEIMLFLFTYHFFLSPASCW